MAEWKKTFPQIYFLSQKCQCFFDTPCIYKIENFIIKKIIIKNVQHKKNELN